MSTSVSASEDVSMSSALSAWPASSMASSVVTCAEPRHSSSSPLMGHRNLPVRLRHGLHDGALRSGAAGASMRPRRLRQGRRAQPAAN